MPRILQGMIRLALGLLLFTAPLLRAADPAADPAADLEQEVAALVARPDVTVVHFWAPWCSNCDAEMTENGWAKFIVANPEVRFVFLNVWHRDQDPARKLRAGGLGAQPNLVLRTHPNPASTGDARLNAFLGLPITWLPTTWVFREGRLRFALNYGEIRFPLLQQLINDTRADW